MRTSWPALLLLASGCEWEFDPSPNDRDDGTGRFAVSIDALAPGAAFADYELGVRVAESVFEGDGPEQRTSIQFVVDHEFDPYADDADIAFQLREGEYDNVLFALSVQPDSDGSRAIEFEAENDDVHYRLQIDGVDLVFDVGRLRIDEDRTATGRVVFDPLAWVAAIGAQAAEGEIRVDSNSPEYAALVRAVEETTTFELDESGGGGGGSTDDDDDDGSDTESD